MRKRVLAVPQGKRLKNGEENGLLRLLQWRVSETDTSSSRLLITVSITSNAVSRLLGTARVASINAYSLTSPVDQYIYKACKRHQIGLLCPRHHIVWDFPHRVEQNRVVAFGHSTDQSDETRSPSVRFHNHSRVGQNQVALSLCRERIGLFISTGKPTKGRQQRNRSVSRALQQRDESSLHGLPVFLHIRQDLRNLANQAGVLGGAQLVADRNEKRSVHL